MLIAQAGLLFFDGTADDLHTFVRTGSLAAERRGTVMPCSTVMLEAMQRATEIRRDRRR